MCLKRIKPGEEVENFPEKDCGRPVLIGKQLNNDFQ